MSLVAVFLVVPLVASAGNSGQGKKVHDSFVSPKLLESAAKHPNQKIRVIITADEGTSDAVNAAKSVGALQRKLSLVDGAAVELSAGRLAALSKIPGLTITPDAPVQVSGSVSYSSNQLWPYEAGLAKMWPTSLTAPKAPTIAIIDSGIDAGRADFAGRVVAQVNMSTLPNNTAGGDGRGHGTFVAGIAAGAGKGYAGAAPNANLVMVDVMDDTGMARTSDVIAACQWVLANKDQYGIRVLNLSLHSTTPSNFTRDPLDKAVEALWFKNVVVVAAAGNYGVAGGPIGVKYAPGNDPFVITVGALDIGGTIGVGNDLAASWSAYGYTYDGFWKPEIGAAGRYMIGPIPPASSLAAEKAANVTAPGYIQLSGTSFASPAVAGAASMILARHPNFTPDQVKGALMLTAKEPPKDASYALGVGELNAEKAATLGDPPNPNRALDQFLVTIDGAKVFDGASWLNAVKAGVAWDDVAWDDVAWSDAVWSAVAWGDVAWEDVAWQDASAGAVAWGDVAWQDVAWEDAAEGDANLEGGYTMSEADVAELSADPDLAVSASVLPPELAGAAALP